MDARHLTLMEREAFIKALQRRRQILLDVLEHMDSIDWDADDPTYQGVHGAQLQLQKAIFSFTSLPSKVLPRPLPKWTRAFRN